VPRYVLGKKRLSTEDRALKYGKRKAERSAWIDPFPWVHGTLPEKMVYAELSRRNVPFYFLNDFRYAIPEVELIKEYQNDFYIPALDLIIEVQGSYWHTKSGAIESDAYKFAVMQMTGRKVLAWWDFDIINRLQELFAEYPPLAAYRPSVQYTKSMEQTPFKRTKIDTSKGIRTLNRKRAQRVAYKKAAPRVRIRK
jgi:very-short-patch-repair endonuclease